jgi:hypothetical protein
MLVENRPLVLKLCLSVLILFAQRVLETLPVKVGFLFGYIYEKS